MNLRLQPVTEAEGGWLLSAVTPYFIELVPGVEPPDRAELAKWWTEADRSAWAIHAGDGPRGFAMIRRARDLHELSEFGIFPTFRGKGLGAEAAALCFALHPGRWQLGVAGGLPGTARFWDRLLPTLPGIRGLARYGPFTPYQTHSYQFVREESP